MNTAGLQIQRSGIKPNGVPFDHLTSFKNNMSGLANQINTLKKQVKSGVFEGDALKAAEGVIESSTKQYESMRNVFNSAVKEAKKNGKVYD